MQENDFKELIKDDSFINYCLSRNERDIRYWQNWIKENPQHASHLDAIRQLVTNMGLQAADDAAKESYLMLKSRIAGQHQMKAQSFGPNRAWLKYAAVIAILACASILWFGQKRILAPRSAGTEVKEIGPGGNKAILTFADGSKISLTDAKTGELANLMGVTVTKTAEGEIVYATNSVNNSPDHTNASYNTIETPRGGQYQIILPDGSKAWLNAASSLSYPVRFASNERRVKMTGEVYFEIAKDKTRPFRVASTGQEVAVLGTHFNVNAYGDELASRTTLLEGSVRLISLKTNKSVLMKPGQCAEVSGNIKISPADIDQEMAWKKGDFIFRGESLQSIMRKVSRWYDIDVIYQPNLPQIRFDGMVSRKRNMSAVLDMIESTGKIHFKIEGRRITVMK